MISTKYFHPWTTIIYWRRSKTLLSLVRTCGGYEHRVEHVRALTSHPWTTWSRWPFLYNYFSYYTATSNIRSLHSSSIINIIFHFLHQIFLFMFLQPVPPALFGLPRVSRGGATPAVGVPLPGPEPVCSRHDLWLHTVPPPAANQQWGLATSHQVPQCLQCCVLPVRATVMLWLWKVLLALNVFLQGRPVSRCCTVDGV